MNGSAHCIRPASDDIRLTILPVGVPPRAWTACRRALSYTATIMVERATTPMRKATVNECTFSSDWQNIATTMTAL